MTAREPLVSLGPVWAGDNPFLRGHHAPLRSEAEVQGPLPIDGAVPPTLEGIMVRNGPNPAVVDDPATYHHLAGDGMVHAVRLAGGQAVSYANRWVRTRRLAAEIGTPGPRGPFEAVDGPVNGGVVFHGGRILALGDTGFPALLGEDLATRTLWDFDAMLASPMAAHPHTDPDSGAMAFFGTDLFGPPYLRYHEVDAAGDLVHSTDVGIPRATMQHDFGVTSTRIAFLDLPAVFDPVRSALPSVPFCWDPGAGARVGLLGRGRPGVEVVWPDLDPCYATHVMNAYDDGAAVVLDVCRTEPTRDAEDPLGGVAGLPWLDSPATLERWRVTPGSARVDVRRLDDRGVGMPRVDPRCAGRPYRYGYCAEMAHPPTLGGTALPVALLKYDLVRDEVVRRDFPAGMIPGEPVFVRAPDGRADDEGWVLTLVYDAGRDASDLWILQATALRADPEAVVHLPGRVPSGTHGTWIPA